VIVLEKKLQIYDKQMQMKWKNLPKS